MSAAAAKSTEPRANPWPATLAGRAALKGTVVEGTGARPVTELALPETLGLNETLLPEGLVDRLLLLLPGAVTLENEPELRGKEGSGNDGVEMMERGNEIERLGGSRVGMMVGKLSVL